MQKRTKLLIPVVAAVLAAGGYVTYWLARRQRRLSIEARIDRYQHIIHRHAQANALPAEFVRAVIRAESAGRPRAVSARNAKGLMQITPITQREVQRRLGLPPGDLFDPEYNIRLGTSYLRLLANRFGGDAYLAVAAYHMGPTRLQKIRDAHPELPARELVEAHATAATIRYCRAVLGGRTFDLGVVRQE
ncbi:MAG: hypothetical protein B1H04_05330 [Planctomycetales bacterium 4484_123]|nr:MAG: hypothetical protein B1H04_05330 [Planctomycetales bacterium 4484_123]